MIPLLVSKKKKIPPILKQLQHLLDKGLQATAPQWPPLRHCYELVHQATHILANEVLSPGAVVRERYLAHVSQMRQQQAQVGPLSEAIEHFGHITDNFAGGLFHCYDVEGLPRTNNDLEHCFGVARVHERRATGRRGAIPGVVVRGSVRLMAVVATKQHLYSAQDLRPGDYQRWWELRTQLQQSEQTRRLQFRFRKDSAAYLATLEAQLLM